MARTQGWGRVSGIACLLAMSLASGRATASERSYETPLGTVFVDVDSNWSAMRTLPNGIEGIGFEVDGGKVMQFMLGTVEDMPSGVLDAGTLRRLTNELRRSDEADQLEVSEEILTLSGRGLRGYYYLATNPAAIPAPGDYKNMYTGYISVGPDALLFVIAWNEGGKSAADRALTALKRLRIEQR